MVAGWQLVFPSTMTDAEGPSEYFSSSSIHSSSSFTFDCAKSEVVVWWFLEFVVCVFKKGQQIICYSGIGMITRKGWPVSFNIWSALHEFINDHINMMIIYWWSSIIGIAKTRRRDQLKEKTRVLMICIFSVCRFLSYGVFSLFKWNVLTRDIWWVWRLVEDDCQIAYQRHLWCDV